MDKRRSHWSTLTEDEKTSAIVGPILLISFIAFLFLTVFLPIERQQTWLPRPSYTYTIPSYYFTQTGADGKEYTLKHDPLAEQEGGLRTTGHHHPGYFGGWIEQFKEYKTELTTR